MATAGEVTLTTTTAVPAVAVGVPVTAAMDRGIEWTQGIAGLYVRQKLEPLEMLTGIESKNKYNIVQIPVNGFPTEIKSSVMAPFREQANNHALLKAREQSECLKRICCPLFRDFKMPFTDAAGTVFFEIERPFKCDPCYGPPLCMTTSQELSIKDKNGSLVAKAEETTGCCKACCTRSFKITGADGADMYTMEASECTTASGHQNCCSPTICNEDYEVVLKDPSGKILDSSHFVWPGCNCGGIADLSNMVIKFPEEATPDQRAGIVAGMMLIEFAVQEFKRQQNNNNNGGGGGGAPPKNEEMRR